MQEDAALYEKIQLILVGALTQSNLNNSSQNEIKDYISTKFSNEKLKANIEIYNDGYVISYGIHTPKILVLDSTLNEITSNLATIGKTDEWEYTINDDNSATLTVYKKNISGNFDIPNIIDNHLVSGLGDDLFNYATKMTSISLPEGLTSIGARTFQGCSNLEWDVKFPSTLTSIGDNAFNGCGKITGNLDEIMNSNVKYGKGVFMRCNSLTGNIETLIGMLDENETVISESLFSGFSGATGNLVIPARITKIEDNAFYGCSGINSISFESSDTLKSIGNYSFYQCTGLNGNLNLPSSVESIGEYAFYENTGITSLDLPDSLSSMGQYAFAYCKNLGGNVNISENLNKLENDVFNFCSNLTDVIFKNNHNKSTTEIGDYAFRNCSNLKNITLPDKLSIIGIGTFYNCNALKTLYLPNSLNIINTGAFNNCSNLNITHWSNNLQTIEPNAFLNCKSLTILPDLSSLNTIEESAFSNCLLLGSSGENNVISWLATSAITELEDSIFKNCSYLTGDYFGNIINKNNVQIKISGAPFAGTNVKFSKVLDLEGKSAIKDSEYAGVTKFFDANENEITTINIPDNITSIGASAFSGCTSITSVNISNNVTIIGSKAFMNCKSLSSIKLPENTSYTIMASSLLDGCSNLQSIEIPKYINTISINALANCNFESLYIPSNVKYIGGGAFANSYNLKSITISEGVESIGYQFVRGAPIEEIIIPNSTITLETTCLHYCPNLKKITIGKGVTKIPQKMLYATGDVEEITIKGNITEIGSSAFANVRSLKKLDMNWKNITKIESKAFFNCPNLTGNVTLNPSCSIAEDAFQKCPLNITK